MVNGADIETKLANFLTSMNLPEKWEKDAGNAVGKLLGQERLEERIAEIKKIIARIDFRWDMGFVKQEEYIQKREELKAQLAELQPIPQDELIEAHRTLKEFPERWEKGNAEERQRLLYVILCRVWVLDDHICALMLRPCYFVVIHEGIARDSIEDIEPSERPPFQQKENGNFHVMESCR